MRFQNGCKKVVIELRFLQFWSEIMLVISNRTRAARSFDFEITRMILDQIALHSVQSPLYYSHSEITEFKQYQYFIDQVAGLLKSGNRKAFTSPFVFETEMMRYRTKVVRFKTEMMRFRT